MRGNFVFYPGTEKELIVPNTIVDQGEEAFLQMIAHGNNTVVPAGDNFWIGLMGAAFEETTILSSIVDEPTVTNGYSRKPITRDTFGWAAVDEVNGIKRVRSINVAFEAIGGNYSVAISRAFLCNVETGTAGVLFAVAGALPAPLLIEDGLVVPIAYELYLR